MKSDIPITNPLKTAFVPSGTEIGKALDSLIMSASGWRKIFARDGDENGLTGDISPPDMFLSAAMGRVFSHYIRDRAGANPVAALGMDTRHTGPIIADLIMRALLAGGCSVRFLGVTPAPEIMTYARYVDGFVYVSASHNPPGHNGVKFGLKNGSVLSDREIGPLITAYRNFVTSPDFTKALISEIDTCDPALLAAAYSGEGEEKQTAKIRYADFLTLVITAAKDAETAEERMRIFSRAARELGGKAPGILSDFNGGSRILSVDKDFFTNLGCPFYAINDVPGIFAHSIIPEGASLDACRAELEKLHRKNPSILAGYVPDCDGDRGNIVYIDESTGGAYAMEAQEVFAFAVAAELAYLRWLALDNPDGAIRKPLAVVANDPTSLRIEDVAEAFDARVFRAEVGEANVVNLARELREKGYEVRVLGEGSNGGTIIHPSAVRDPITTMGALLKVLLPLPAKNGVTLRRILAEAFGIRFGEGDTDFSLRRLMEALPAWVTTRVDDDRAKLTVTTADHGALKTRFEEAFIVSWESRKNRLSQQFGIQSFKEINYEGTKAIEGFGPDFRSGAARGGLKIQLYNKSGKPEGFVWMRGSGTEPVFRILADIRGKAPWKEEELLSWLTDLIKEADGKS